MRAILVICLSLFAACAGAGEHSRQCDATMARQLVSDAYARRPIGTLPHYVTWEPATRRLLSARLMQAFAGADAHLDAWLEDDKQRHVKADPSRPPLIRKPPFSDGDFMTGTFEGESSQYTVEPARELGGEAWDVAVHAPPEASLVGWAVTVRVIVDRDRCAIDEVRYEDLDGDGGTTTLTRWLSYRGN